MSKLSFDVILKLWLKRIQKYHSQFLPRRTIQWATKTLLRNYFLQTRGARVGWDSNQFKRLIYLFILICKVWYQVEKENPPQFWLFEKNMHFIAIYAIMPYGPLGIYLVLLGRIYWITHKCHRFTSIYFTWFERGKPHKIVLSGRGVI